MKAAKPQRPEVHIPFSVVDLDEPDVFTAERLTDIDPLLVPADAAVITNAADFIMARILERGKPRRIRARGRGIVGGGRRILERLVRAERVEFLAPGGEAVLLRTLRVTRRARAPAFECAMHAFVPAVLLRRGGLDEVGQDPEANPPDGERREPAERLGGKRDAIVRADADR